MHQVSQDPSQPYAAVARSGISSDQQSRPLLDLEESDFSDQRFLLQCAFDWLTVAGLVVRRLACLPRVETVSLHGCSTQCSLRLKLDSHLPARPGHQFVLVHSWIKKTRVDPIGPDMLLLRQFLLAVSLFALEADTKI